MSYQPFPPTAGPATSPSPGRRNPALLIIGILVAVAGLVGGLLLVLSASSSTEDSVENMARAPAGCTTTLDFDSTGEFLVFFERRGTLSGLGDGCATADGSFEHDGDRVPDQQLTLVGPDDTQVKLEDADGTSYDAGGFSGTQIATVQIDDKGEYELTVDPDDPDDTSYAIAIGKDPTANEGTLRIAGIGVIIAGLLVGGLLILLGLRRRTATPSRSATAPGWPQGSTAAVPGWPPAAPAAPPYAGPPTSFGSPGTTRPGATQPGVTAQPTQPIPWTIDPTRPGSSGGWTSPAQEEPPRPVPPPDPFSRPPGN